jgi:hypothetical protein
MSVIPFSFEDGRTSRGATFWATIPENIASKQALLATLARQLGFPDYDHPLSIVFPTKFRDLIFWLLRSRDT